MPTPEIEQYSWMVRVTRCSSLEPIPQRRAVEASTTPVTDRRDASGIGAAQSMSTTGS